MKDLKTTEAQRRASRKWDAANKKIKDKSRAKSGCKKYITTFADFDDLEEVKAWIEEREKKFKK
ncbi:hypothetical protein [uncultured Peptoniphilus sp.]|uniref:hypothetical protein n=1 Tax=uncultured Peptoniphilus sp. TaxID=254354 RepID=UPI00280566A3|nr:hypothetical protein [uncultured Peptoniphilus sp.]